MPDVSVRTTSSDPMVVAAVQQLNNVRTDIKTRSSLPHADTNQAAVATANAVDLPTSIALANALAAAHNTHLADTTAHPSADTLNTDASPTAVDLPTTQTLLNNLKAEFNKHVISGASVKQAIAQASAVTVTLNPPAASIVTCRVTGGTALAGPRVVVDAGGTPTAPAVANALPGVATLSDDGATLTFDAAVTGITIEYLPRGTQVHNQSDGTSQVATANAVDLPSSQALANAIKTALNGHIAKGFSSSRIALTPF